MLDIKKLKEKKTIQELLEFGIIIFDKPADCTSFDVSDFVRKKLKLRKTSHFGTLDPMVTGVLPIALNRAVKLTGYFLGEDKEYEGTMHIHEDVSIAEIKKVIDEKFMGKIIQLPPVRSSVKRQEREREIKKFELLEKKGKEVSFLVECQGGTYVRKLVHDLGEEMEIGAHMIGLKRIRAGIFTKNQMVTKEEFEKAVEEYFKGNEKLLRKIIVPAEIVSEVYPIIEVKKEFVEKILHGSPIDEKFLVKKQKMETGKIISIFNDDKFIGMFKVVNEGNIFAKSQFVLQEIRG
ncbi:RNA-guided pseudouridylation complex pseudouridine synthase subunit Cbf5 [Candidatus Pacearchaeota archaeon]|jgi:H/ACA ribonucleoprotein complex subunit 4|nr:RNA-guided pseudouridylation complex pseudouridine synthase subunit Cbf5 [Candidatus Pacearchaeota archaeon]